MSTQQKYKSVNKNRYLLSIQSTVTKIYILLRVQEESTFTRITYRSLLQSSKTRVLQVLCILKLLLQLAVNFSPTRAYTGITQQKKTSKAGLSIDDVLHTEH
jgi:hypothetical protein